MVPIGSQYTASTTSKRPVAASWLTASVISYSPRGDSGSVRSKTDRGKR
jgi:hypothetical protein